MFDNKPGFAWYRTTLPAIAGVTRSLWFEGVDDNAFVYLNGKRLEGEPDQANAPFNVSLDSAWKEGGPNELGVLVENTAGTGRH